MIQPPRRTRRPRSHQARPAAVLALLVALLVAPAARAATPAAACAAAIAATEPGSHLPAGLLSAIAMVESGRIDPGTAVAVAWPWTINIAGAGQVFETAPAAVAAVQAAQQAGTHSIDVGCMQVNLYFHPHAFTGLDEAFDPLANVRYAARFLAALYAQTGDWPSAVAAYHSATPELGLAYAQRVAASWPLAARFGLTAGMTTTAQTMAALASEVDPNHVLTPAFRAQMIAAAAFRHQREAALLSGTRPQQPARTPPVAALEAEVDARHVLTPEFRAQLVAAAAFRHQREAALHAIRPVAAPAAPPVSRIAAAW